MPTFDVKAPNGQTVSIDGPTMPDQAALDLIFKSTGTSAKTDAESSTPRTPLVTQLGPRPTGGYTTSDTEPEHPVMDALKAVAHPETARDVLTLMVPTEAGAKLAVEGMGSYLSALKNAIAETKSLKGIPVAMLKVLYKEAYPASKIVPVEQASSKLNAALFQRYHASPSTTATTFQAIIDALPKAEVEKLQQTAASHLQEVAKATAVDAPIRKPIIPQVVNEDFEKGRELGALLARLATKK